jgi:hypothetical protein
MEEHVRMWKSESRRPGTYYDYNTFRAGILCTRSGARNGNSEVSVYFLKAKQGYTVGENGKRYIDKFKLKLSRHEDAWGERI